VSVVCPGRLGSKLDEVKGKYLRSEAKVRSAHNSYVIALNDANLYQRQYSCVILPAMLDAQQHFQEDLIKLWSVFSLVVAYCRLTVNSEM